MVVNWNIVGMKSQISIYTFNFKTFQVYVGYIITKTCTIAIKMIVESSSFLWNDSLCSIWLKLKFDMSILNEIKSYVIKMDIMLDTWLCDTHMELFNLTNVCIVSNQWSRYDWLWL